MSILSQEFIFAALDAEKAGEQFPISLNDEKVWQALGYSQFRYAVQRLETFQSFKYEVDYVCIPVTTNQDTYLLSVDAYKSLALIADTQQGQETRRYFIQIEKEYRQQLERQFQQSTQEIQIPLVNRQGLAALKELREIIEVAKSIGNMRLIQQAENNLSQYMDAFVSLSQTTVNNNLPASEQVNKRFESIIDVAIRLGKNIPSNLESSLGRYAGKFIGHLREEQKDNRTASASGKRLNVYLYPANSFDVEQCVLDYCDQKGI